MKLSSFTISQTSNASSQPDQRFPMCRVTKQVIHPHLLLVTRVQKRLFSPFPVIDFMTDESYEDGGKRALSQIVDTSTIDTGQLLGKFLHIGHFSLPGNRSLHVVLYITEVQERNFEPTDIREASATTGVPEELFELLVAMNSKNCLGYHPEDGHLVIWTPEFEAMVKAD